MNASIMELYDFTLKDFKAKVAESFLSLREDNYFHDVTLVSDDQKQVNVHRVVLAACSKYFKNILVRNPQHTLVCLPGINEQDLKSILDYAYCGEVKVRKENLGKFLELAKRFALDGFSENGSGLDFKGTVKLKKNDNFQQADESDVDSKGTVELNKNVDDDIIKKDDDIIKKDDDITKKDDDMYVDFMKAIENPIPKNITKSEKDLPEDYIKILYHSFKYDAASKVYFCNSCAFKSNHKDHMKEHVERHHMKVEGVSFQCNVCGRSFPSRPGLKDHQRRIGRCHPGIDARSPPITGQKYKVKFGAK